MVKKMDVVFTEKNIKGGLGFRKNPRGRHYESLQTPDQNLQKDCHTSSRISTTLIYIKMNMHYRILSCDFSIMGRSCEIMSLRPSATKISSFT